MTGAQVADVFVLISHWIALPVAALGLWFLRCACDARVEFETLADRYGVFIFAVLLIFAAIAMALCEVSK